MIGGISIRELLEAEIIERREEGVDVPDYSARMENADDKELETIYEELMALPIRPDFPYEEPDELADILAASTGCTYKKTPNADTIVDQFHGAWLGRIAGCILGKPVEVAPYGRGDETHAGWEYIKLWQEGAGQVFPPENYIPGTSKAGEQYGIRVISPDSFLENIRFAESDDDIRYMVLGLLMNEQKGNDFTPNDLADLWHKTLTKSMVFTAEFVAMRNSYNCTLTDPKEQVEYCRRYRNPYREWIGAQIRVDHYGYYNAGDPLTAAKAAYQDATFSHTKNGVYGAMFCAAMIAAAFTEPDVEKCIEIGLSVIPQKSRLYADIRFGMQAAKESKTPEDLYKAICRRFKDMSSVHTNNNAAVCAAALLMGKGDYTKSVSIVVGAGWDTDCNGATVGSVLGAMHGTGCIPAHLSEPLHDTLYSSVPGFHPIAISACAKRTYEAYRKKAHE